VVLMNPDNIAAAGLSLDQTIRLISDAGDGIDRALGGLKIIAYRIPRGTIASYYPECNVLISIDNHDTISKNPASKSVPVRIEVEAG